MNLTKGFYVFLKSKGAQRGNAAALKEHLFLLGHWRPGVRGHYNPSFLSRGVYFKNNLKREGKDK
jgi:hypothetical protein